MKLSDSGAGLGPGSDSGPSLALSPSSIGYSSGTMAEIAARVVSEFAHDDDDDDYYYDNVLCRNDAFPEPEFNDRLEEETTEPAGDENEGEEKEDDDSEFEFEFAVPAGEDNSSPISADEIFYNGQIRPLFPVFDTDLVFADTDWRSKFLLAGEISSQPAKPPVPVPSTSAQEESSNSKSPQTIPIRLPLKKLLLSERETSVTASGSCSSSEADELEGVTPGTYCVWTPPKQEMRKKSKSTGSSKRWKLRNLVNRSHSDGRDNFVFLTPKQQYNERTLGKEKPAIPSTPGAAERSGSGGRTRKEKDTASSSSTSTAAAAKPAVGEAHREHYLKNRAMRENDRKKSYLPYRQDLVAFFANVNGLSRTIQPF